MVLLRVISIDEAYNAVDWRTIFLIAGLIPLGSAMDRTGTAAFVAGGVMNMLGSAPRLLVFTAVGLLATLFSLFMSNVAATVLLVPLVSVIGADAGIDPRALAAKPQRFGRPVQAYRPKTSGQGFQGNSRSASQVQDPGRAEK